MNNFRNLKIWKQGIELVMDVYALSQVLPEEEKFGLRSQITRAAVSIPSNIAEGSSRSSDRDFKRYLEIALGSTFELETQLFIIQQLQCAKSELLYNILNKLCNEQKMIQGFINKLRNAEVRG